MPRFLEPQKQWKWDQAQAKKHQDRARSEFRKLLQQVEPQWLQAKADFPGKSNDQRRKRERVFVKLVKDLPAVVRYLDQYIGGNEDDRRAGSWRATVVYLLRDIKMGKKTVKDAAEKINQLAAQGYQALTMTEAQSPLRSSIPEELRGFLPSNIVVDVDEDGYIQRVTDRFENERFTLEKKIERLRYIVAEYNSIVKQVKKDLASGDEVTRLAALVTSIIMETGIRPGREGNKKLKTENGESVEVETFGAVTLGPKHVRFIRDGFAELEFVGKASTVNFATLSNAQVISILEQYVEKARGAGSKYVFVTEDGRRFEYKDLQRYFKQKFSGIAPTDFRKLRATEQVWSSLREQQEALYEEIRSFAGSETEELKERVVAALVRTIDKALKDAQKALSHEDVAVTKGSYVNPRVLLDFFSRGRAADSLKGAVLSGQTVLQFDPMTFVQMAEEGRNMAASGGLSLLDVLERLEEDLADS